MNDCRLFRRVSHLSSMHSVCSWMWLATFSKPQQITVDLCYDNPLSGGDFPCALDYKR